MTTRTPEDVCTICHVKMEKAKALAKQAKLNSDISQVGLVSNPLSLWQMGSLNRQLSTRTSGDVCTLHYVKIVAMSWEYWSIEEMEFLVNCLFVCCVRTPH